MCKDVVTERAVPQCVTSVDSVWRSLRFACTVIAMMAMFAPWTSASESTGAGIYKQECARCHGASGEGAKKYPQPLVGDNSPAQLTRVIARTMPDDDPESLSPEDARKVAVYMYDAFYSPDAQAKANPPRIALSRLTVRQYRNAVADLIGSFRQSIKAG